MYTWLLEERLNDSDFTHLSEALTHKGKTWSRFPGLFAGHSTHSDKLPSDPFFFHGTISGALMIHNHRNCIFPFTPKNYACTSYYPYYQTHLLNKYYRIYQMSQLGQHNLLNRMEDHVFVRPDSGLKNFVGEVIESSDISNLKNRCSHYDLTDLVVIAPVQKVEREWRLLFRTLPGAEYTVKYITGSQYHNAGEFHVSADVPQDIIDYATNVLNIGKYFPDPLFYIDIAQSGETLHINEFSAFMCAGLYACDVNKIIDEIYSIDWM